MCMFCEKMVKKCRNKKVLGMRLSIVENVPTSRGSILKLWAASQLPYNEKNKNPYRYIYIYDLREFV